MRRPRIRPTAQRTTARRTTAGRSWGRVGGQRSSRRIPISVGGGAPVVLRPPHNLFATPPQNTAATLSSGKFAECHRGRQTGWILTVAGCRPSFATYSVAFVTPPAGPGGGPFVIFPPKPPDCTRAQTPSRCRCRSDCFDPAVTHPGDGIVRWRWMVRWRLFGPVCRRVGRDVQQRVWRFDRLRRRLPRPLDGRPRDGVLATDLQCVLV